MSSVNLSEVLGRFARDGHDTQLVLSRLLASPIEFVSFSDADAEGAAALLPATQPHGLSLGDRACLSLAKLRGIPAVTADTVWSRLSVGIQVELIR